MSTPDQPDTQLDKTVLRQHRWRRRRRKFVRYALFLIVVGFVLNGVLDYLANMPRERYAQGFSYFERVWLGTKKAFRLTQLSLEANHEDLKNTQLPVTEIYIKGKRMDALQKHLPQTDLDLEKAKVRLGGKIYDAEVRFRGDSVNHWAFPNKSWRIVLRDGKFYQGMNEFNLNVPRVRTQISNWLGYQMAERMGGLLVPHAEFVHFRLNRQFDGVRLLLEQPNQDFLRRKRLPVGKIFVGDIESEQIYGGEERPLLYFHPDAWKVKSPTEEEGNKELRALSDIIKKEHDPYRFYDRMQALVDIPALTKYMAFLELVGSVHVDETHNGKLYFNPDSGKFSPIVWDSVAYFWKNEMPLDMGTNALFRVTNSNPEFRAQKDRALWEAIHGPLAAPTLHELVSQETSKLRPDMYAFALKLHANDKGIEHISNQEWEEALAELHSVIDERHAMIRRELAVTNVAYRVTQPSSLRAFLGVQIQSRSGVEIKKLTLNFEKAPEGTTVTLTRRGVADVGPDVDPAAQKISAVVQDGKAVFALRDHLFSKRKYIRRKSPEIVPATYVYEVSLPQGASLLENVTFDAMNAVSLEPHTPTRDDTLAISPKHKKNIVWWSPDQYRMEQQKVLQGVVDVNETLEVEPGTVLTIKAGALLKMAPGASLFVNGGRLIVEGTEAKPVHVLAQNSEEGWGVVALRNSKDSVLEHMILEGGTRDRLDFVDYQGALSIHHSTASLRSVTLKGDYLSAQHSTITMEKCRFENIFPFYMQTEHARVHEKGTKKINVPAVLHKSILNETGYGTAARAEREFKYSLRAKNLSEYRLEDISKRLRKALAKKGDDREVWNAPRHTQSDYYVDDKTEDFVFRDIYFDTPDDHAYRERVSYRLRNRYKSWKAYKIHVKQQDWPEEWPYRLEFQAKTGRQELGRGYSTVQEARFEFRKESTPFSEINLPPSAPWDLDEFIPYFQTGMYKGMATLPGQAVMELFRDEVADGESLNFEPRLAVLTERFRQHLNIQSDYGSGPNPEQSFIISLDKSRVYDGPIYVKYLRAKKLGVKNARRPDTVGTIVEIEVEFERNVSDVLDRRIAEAQASGDMTQKERLEEVRAAFLQDQEVIMQVVQDAFKKKGIDLIPAQKSKYVQAFEIATGGEV